MIRILMDFVWICKTPLRRVWFGSLVPKAQGKVRAARQVVSARRDAHSNGWAPFLVSHV